ncbi:hypothetical protein B0T14DRAFT_496386 [Immersiella caudata]|uniref:Peptidase metallopeptidase domain-containing protein n=1 Tax=Immersiella caudata TaxID=314043 RepID=A0AA39WQK7_9PEZI|nr:hypothetical protein B0T14DRAFT_496386 [Immersiella caudata]
MSAIPQGKRGYPCATQEGVMLTFGYPPEAPSSGGRNRPKIKIGTQALIPRWVPSTKLLYFVVKDGFTDDDFKHAKSSFKEAADDWNALSFGVTISPTSNKAEANFLVRYYEEKDNDRTLARAFFPNEVKDVLIFNNSLTDPYWRKLLKNTILHELGHVIGLRHEFANDQKAGAPAGQKREQFAHQIGGDNRHSVMSYDDDVVINELDKKDVLEFYKMENGHLINKVPITDYVAKPLQQN